MAEWLCSGLQIRLCRFDSGPRLQFVPTNHCPHPAMSLEQILKAISNLKLSGGLAGRVCTVLIVVAVVLGGIGIASGNWMIQAACIAVMAIIVCPVLWRVLNIAEKTPAVAILDSQHYMQHERMINRSKGRQEIVVEDDQKKLAVPSSSSSTALDQPDEPPKLTGPEGSSTHG